MYSMYVCMYRMYVQNLCTVCMYVQNVCTVCMNVCTCVRTVCMYEQEIESIELSSYLGRSGSGTS